MPAYLNASPILGRIDFVPGQRTVRPLPPIGHRLDGRRSESTSALFAATKQTTVITLGGSTATGDISTLTITPTKTASGSPWADSIPALVITVTTAGTQTLTALGELIEAEAAAIVNISSLTDHADWQPIADFCEVTAASGVITVITRDAGARFDYTFVTDGSATETSTTDGEDDTELRAGTVCSVSSTASDGYKTVITPISTSTAAATLGVVMEGIGCKPASSGYSFKVYAAGLDVPVETKAPCTVYAEGAGTVGGDVYYRKTATGTEIAGAVVGVAGVTVDTLQVFTLTPTAVDSTLYSTAIVLKNWFTGAVVSQGNISFTSGIGTSATLICNGLRTSLVDDNDHLDSIVVGTGTATLILTVASPYKIELFPDSPGVLAGYATPSTAGASDHLLWSGATFAETCSAAGIAAINLPT
jgi:hypothetical protein